MKYRVWSLDVWGDGTEYNDWTVNDRREIGSIDLPEDADAEQIAKALRTAGYLDVNRVDIDGTDDLLFVDATYDGRPLLQLEGAE